MMVHSKVCLQFEKKKNNGEVLLNLINQPCVTVGVALKEGTGLTSDSGFRQQEPSCTHVQIFGCAMLFFYKVTGLQTDRNKFTLKLFE